MEKKTFNPLEWMENPTQQSIHTEQAQPLCNSNESEVETIIQQIEANQIDIATAYSDWRNIGFAFADEFGESGRDYFHRISRFYSDYSASECDRQFDNCLKAKGQGVSLKTFFYHAKQAGVQISKPKTTSQLNKQEMPNLPDSLFPELPDFLQRVVSVATSNEEKDLLLLGSLVSISACLPKLLTAEKCTRIYFCLSLPKPPQVKAAWYIAASWSTLSIRS